MLWACTCIFRGLKLSQRSTFSSLQSVLIVRPLINIISFIFYRVGPIAMDRAIKEILSGVVQRSVNIASQTTKELVLKVCHGYHVLLSMVVQSGHIIIFILFIFLFFSLLFRLNQIQW